MAYEKCLELQPDSRNAGQNRLLALNYIHQGEDAWVCREHERWGAEFQGGFEALPPLSGEGEDPQRRLVVGYISPDFFTHSVSYFAEAPLTHHNPDRWAANRCGMVHAVQRGDGKVYGAAFLLIFVSLGHIQRQASVQ